MIFTNIIKSILILMYLNCYSCYQWPKNIKRCSLNDTSMPFNKCLLEVTKATAPILAHGIKAWGVTPLDPYKMLDNMVMSSDRPPISITYTMTNGSIEGVSKVNVKKARYDPKTKEMYFLATHKKLTLTGNYDLQGTLFGLKINSYGKVKLESYDIEQVFVAKIVPTKRRGYMTPRFRYTINNMSNFVAWLSDSRLPPFLERAMIKVINDNWQQVTRALIPTAERAFEKQYDLYLAPLFQRFLFADIIIGEEMFPEKSATRLDTAGEASHSRHDTSEEEGKPVVESPSSYVN